MYQDQRGHAMTTESPAAAAALDTAIFNFLHWKSALMPEIKAALEADPGFGLAQAVNGLVLHAARNIAYRPMIGDSLAAAKAAEVAMTPREKLYVAANHWPRAWYRRALDNPAVQVSLDGETTAYRAVPVSGEEHDRVDGENSLPLLFRIVTGFPPRYFLRLDPS